MKEGAPAEPRSAQRTSEPGPGTGGVAAANSSKQTNQQQNQQQNPQQPATNFEYDDSEWDVGIGDLIIDLDADIEKNNDSAPTAASAAAGGGGGGDARMGVRQQHSSSMEKGLKMKIKRTSKPGRSSEAKHEIVQVDGKAAAAAAAAGGGAAGASSGGVSAGAAATSDAGDAQSAKAAAKSVGKRAVHKKDRRDKEPSAGGGAARTERAENGTGAGAGDGDAAAAAAGGGPDSPATAPSPQAKRQKTDAPTQSVSDMCVGTDGLVSQGTLLEPDSLGPCEPGTTVSLEGIVWQETQGVAAASPGTPVRSALTLSAADLDSKPTSSKLGRLTISTIIATIRPAPLAERNRTPPAAGVLVVNVTWRGKTYVGTLLDYTRHHDWAPPRFNDSPTAELESRGGKGRGKRGRGAASAPEPTVAETRASAQSKLRSQSKGRRSTANSAGANFTAPASPVKRKGRAADREAAASDRTPNKRSRTNSNTSQSEPASSAPGTPEPATAAPQSPAPSPAPAAPPPLIECPESGCSKKFRHANGLKYHQSHAHSNGLSEGERETGDSCPESPPASKTPPPPVTAPAAVTTPAQLQPQTPPVASVSPAPVASAAAPATSPVTPATPAPAAPPVAASAPANGVGGPAKPAAAAAAPVAVAPQSQLPGMGAAPPSTAGEPTASEPPPTHAKVQISDSNGNVKTSGVLRFGPTVLPTAGAAVPPGPPLLAGAPPPPHRTAASVYQPAAPPPLSGVPARPAAAVTSVTAAARTVPVMTAADAGKYKPKSVAARVATPALPVVTVPPASGGYGQSVAHLKPIQPKPTILGETSPINPALESLRKEKERPKKRRKENGVRTPEASPRPEGGDASRPPAAPRAPVSGAPAGVVSSGAVPAVVTSMAISAGTGVVTSAASGATDRPSRDGTASPAYSDISDDGAPPVDASGRPAAGGVPGVPGGEKKDLPGTLPPQSSVYYRSFFPPPGVYVPPPAGGKPGDVDPKDGPRAAPPGGEYPGVPYLPYPYLPAAYPYPPLDPAGYPPAGYLVDPKYKMPLGGERPPAPGVPGGVMPGRVTPGGERRESDGESGRTSAPPSAEQRAAHSGASRDASPQPAHRPSLATPPRSGALPAQRGAPAPSGATSKRPPPTSSAGPPPPPPVSVADKRPPVSAAAAADAAALAARAAAFGYPPFGLAGLPGLPYGGVLLNGGYPGGRFPVSSAAAVPAAPEDLSRTSGSASRPGGGGDSLPPRSAPYAPPPAHRLLEAHDRARTAVSSAASAAGRAGSPGSPLSAPLRPALSTSLGFPPPGGYNPYTGVPGGGPSPGFAPIK